MKNVKISFIASMSKLIIGLILTLSNFTDITAQSYAVTNASSSPGANGIYIQDDTYGGFPKFNNGSFTLFNTYDQSMKWAIVPNGTILSDDDVSNSPYSYSTKINGSTPPYQGWHHGGNTTGLPGEYIIVIPLNSIGYSVHFFTESVSDNGTIMDTALVYLYAEGIIFTGNNNDDFIVDGKAVVTGLPSGLTAKLIRTSDTTMLAILEGISDNHTMNDNTQIHLAFDNTAVSNNDVSVLEHASFDFGILYQAPFQVEGTNTYTAAIGTYPLMGMYNEFPYFKNGIYYLATKTCNPKWILRSSSNVHPLYSTQIQSEYPENRQWHAGGFFYTMGDPIVVGMENSILYENYSFVETDANDGHFTDSLKIRYFHPNTGSSFSGNVNDDFVDESKILVSNVPEGLTAVINKYDDSTLYAKLSGQATQHEVSDIIQNLKFEFTAGAFNGAGIFATNQRAVDSVNVVYMQKYVLVDTTNFARDLNGVYSPYEIINGVPAFKGQGIYYIIYRNTPDQCVWGVLRQGNQNAVFSSGTDQDYPPANNWVVGDYNGTTTARIEIFPLQPWISFEDLRLEESEEIPGNISDTMKIYLKEGNGITFTGDDSEDYITANKAELVNLPEGLSASMVKESDTELTLYISGNAVNHESSDNVNNLTIQLLDEAFSSNPETVKFSTIYSGKILFNDATALENKSNNPDKLFYPNPSREYIFINLDEPVFRDVYCTFYDSMGKVVLSSKLTHPKIDISALPKGFYIVSIVATGNIFTNKLIIN